MAIHPRQFGIVLKNARIPNIQPVNSTIRHFRCRPVPTVLIKAKNPRIRAVAKTTLTLGNPLYSTLFQFFISPPVTSIRPSQHGLRGQNECHLSTSVLGNISTSLLALSVYGNISNLSLECIPYF